MCEYLQIIILQFLPNVFSLGSVLNIPLFIASYAQLTGRYIFSDGRARTGYGSIPNYNRGYQIGVAANNGLFSD